MTKPLHRRPARAAALLCLLLSAGCAHRLAAAPATTRPATAPPPTASPATAPATAPATDPAGASPAVPPPAAQVAADFVTALNTYDARPGHDRGLHDANARTRPYVTDQVYALIADPQTRNSATLWQQLTTASAVTSVHVDKIAVPEGAPAPTAQRAEVRITYTVTTIGQAATGQVTSASALPSAQTLSQGMQVTATAAGWRIDQLLAF